MVVLNTVLSAAALARDMHAHHDTPHSQGRLHGGSGRNLRPIWLKVGRIPPPRGKNSTVEGEFSVRYMGHK